MKKTVKWNEDVIYDIRKKSLRTSGYQCPGLGDLREAGATEDEHGYENGFKTRERAEEVLANLVRIKASYADFKVVENKIHKKFGKYGSHKYIEGGIYTSNHVTDELLEFIEFCMVKDPRKEYRVSFNVTGRTKHQMLAGELKSKLPGYGFEIGYNYECKFKPDVLYCKSCGEINYIKGDDVPCRCDVKDFQPVQIQR